MRVTNFSAEVSPFAKTGGLADVAGALPKALAALGLKAERRQVDAAARDQRHQPAHQVLGPVVAQAAVPEAHLDQQVVPAGGRRHPVVVCELQRGRASAREIDPDEGLPWEAVVRIRPR